MKIYVNKIPQEGLIQEEHLNPAGLSLDTQNIKICEPIKIKAEITRITNAVAVKMHLGYNLIFECSRCLREFKKDLVKDIQINIPLGKNEVEVDLTGDIRQEIILDYPIKMLCIPQCKGLCPKCGKDLNEGGCSCGST